MRKGLEIGLNIGAKNQIQVTHLQFADGSIKKNLTKKPIWMQMGLYSHLFPSTL